MHFEVFEVSGLVKSLNKMEEVISDAETVVITTIDTKWFRQKFLTVPTLVCSHLEVILGLKEGSVLLSTSC